MMTTATKGFSSVQFAIHPGVARITAGYMEYRVRAARGEDTPVQFGWVEIDETYLGGKRANMSSSRCKALADTGRGTVGKAVVVGFQERSEKVVVMPIAQTDQDTVLPIIKETVEQGPKVCIDESKSYVNLNRVSDRESVKHSAREYVRDTVYINCTESFWALIKRGCYGAHHGRSFNYLHRYLAEYVYRQSTREINGLAAIGALIKSSQGNHLSYADLIKP